MKAANYLHTRSHRLWNWDGKEIHRLRILMLWLHKETHSHKIPQNKIEIFGFVETIFHKDVRDSFACALRLYLTYSSCFCITLFSRLYFTLSSKILSVFLFSCLYFSFLVSIFPILVTYLPITVSIILSRSITIPFSSITSLSPSYLYLPSVCIPLSCHISISLFISISTFTPVTVDLQFN